MLRKLLYSIGRTRRRSWGDENLEYEGDRVDGKEGARGNEVENRWKEGEIRMRRRSRLRRRRVLSKNKLIRIVHIYINARIFLIIFIQYAYIQQTNIYIYMFIVRILYVECISLIEIEKIENKEKYLSFSSSYHVDASSLLLISCYYYYCYIVLRFVTYTYVLT